MAKTKIIPFLWFDQEAEEAARFYVSLFPDSQVGGISRYDEATARAAKMPEGTVLTVEFQLAGQPFLALNGGRPEGFQFTPAVSLLINCEDQAEIDHFWDGLTADGGEPGQCGWLKDRFGVSWQVVPRLLGELMQDPDPARAKRVAAAMLKMTKIEIAGLEEAAKM